jgi:phage repressor protein C with HTH and peptisase S24 domain
LCKIEHFVQKKLSTLNILYMPSGKQFRKALKANDLTVGQAAIMLNLSRGTLYNYFEAEELEEDFVQSVKNRLSIDLNAEPIPFLDQRRNNKLSDEPYLVPFVDVPAQAGYTKAYQQRDYIATLKKYPILPDVDPTGAVWRYFQVDGDSMEPEIQGGDMLLCSQVPKEDWFEIKDKHTHVVVTDESVWIKDVHPDPDELEFWLLSQNPTYEPFIVKARDLRQLWVMRRHIKSRAKKHRMYDMEEVRKKLKGK